MLMFFTDLWHHICLLLSQKAEGVAWASEDVLLAVKKDASLREFFFSEPVCSQLSVFVGFVPATHIQVPCKKIIEISWEWCRLVKYRKWFTFRCLENLLSDFSTGLWKNTSSQSYRKAFFFPFCTVLKPFISEFELFIWVKFPNKI